MFALPPHFCEGWARGVGEELINLINEEQTIKKETEKIERERVKKVSSYVLVKFS